MRTALALVLVSAGVLALPVIATRDAGATTPPHVDTAIKDLFIQSESMRPDTLDKFNFFADAGARRPMPQLIPYELNTPLYSDGADKLRYLYVPEGARIEADGDGLLQFPVGTAIIKTFAFGDRYIETRVLLHRESGWEALPYRWNAEQTEARLALAGGRFDVTTPAGEAISYRIPNKNQCKTCHSLDGVVIPIGPKARNLAPELLARLVSEGKLATSPQLARLMPRWDDETAETAALARAYLDANCAHCHQPGGGASNSGLDLRWQQQDPFAIGVNKPPVAAGRGAGDALVSILPGDPDASIIVHRMDSAEPGVAMPELGRSSIDHKAVAVMRQWIAEMDQ